MGWNGMRAGFYCVRGGEIVAVVGVAVVVVVVAVVVVIIVIIIHRRRHHQSPPNQPQPNQSRHTISSRQCGKRGTGAQAAKHEASREARHQVDNTRGLECEKQ